MNSSSVPRYCRAIPAIFLCLSSFVAAELVITNTQDLSFGQFVAGNGGTVTVSASGVRSSSGDVFLIPSSEGLAAQFQVTGDPDLTYAIQLPANGAVNLTGPGADMALNDFVSLPTVGDGGQLSGTGQQTLSVGATLTVSSGQISGAYSGVISVTVNYN